MFEYQLPYGYKNGPIKQNQRVIIMNKSMYLFKMFNLNFPILDILSYDISRPVRNLTSFLSTNFTLTI